MDGNTTCDAAALVPDAPESVRKVICTLEGHEPMTNKELQVQTGLPRRTLYSALQRLSSEGLVQHRVSLRDTRQTYWWLDDGPMAVAAS